MLTVQYTGTISSINATTCRGEFHVSIASNKIGAKIGVGLRNGVAELFTKKLIWEEVTL
jgi:hypothetical protein